MEEDPAAGGLEQVRNPERVAAVRETGLHDPAVMDSLGHLTSLAVETMGVSTAFVSVVDEDRVVVRASRGNPRPMIEEGTLPVEDSLCSNVVASGRPHAVRDSREAVDSPGSRFAMEKGLISYLGAPVHLGEDGPVAGAFGVGDGSPRQWSDDDREMVELLATGAASELQLRRELHRHRERASELRDRALHDSLTGLANRQLFWHRVENALARSERTGKATGILFLDVDDFKSVNDRLGHVAGDDVLVKIAERLRASVREPDSVARFGGDEFTILLEDLDAPEEANRAAARLVDELDRPFEVADSAVNLSVSIGLATTEEPRGDEDLAHEGHDDATGPASPARRLVQQADWAMYRGKAEGGSSWRRY